MGAVASGAQGYDPGPALQTEWVPTTLAHKLCHPVKDIKDQINADTCLFSIPNFILEIQGF